MTPEQSIALLIKDLAHGYAAMSGFPVPDEHHWSRARRRIEPLLQIARTRQLRLDERSPRVHGRFAPIHVLGR